MINEIHKNRNFDRYIDLQTSTQQTHKNKSLSLHKDFFLHSKLNSREFSRSRMKLSRSLDHLDDYLKLVESKIFASYRNKVYPSSLNEEQLLKEMEDPNNNIVKDDIVKIIGMNRDIKVLERNYERMKRSKSADEKEVSTMRNESLGNKAKYNYQYTSYLKGLSSVVEEYLSKMQKQMKVIPEREMYNNTTMKKGKWHSHSRHILSVTAVITRLEAETNLVSSCTALENLYNTLGHEVYIKLINLFEKYCFYGKTYTNFNMDYSQFCTLLSQNKIYDKTITKLHTDLIFNKIRNYNKSIGFQDFIMILLEISLLVFPWETNFIKRFSYFVNKYIINLPCLVKSLEEKNMERWYFFLECEEFIKEVRKYLPQLHKAFVKNKVKDLKQGDTINVANFLKMSKEMNIVPVFLSSKEIIAIINFVKYRKKSLLPTNNFDFCAFVEIFCVLALQAIEKYNHEELRPKYMEHVDKLKIFLSYVSDRV